MAGLTPILVIAFVVKSHSQVLEDRSDKFLRQALRQEELVKKICAQLRVSGEVKTDIIYPFAESAEMILDQYEMIFKGSRKWQKEHPENEILFVLYVGATIFSEEPINLSNSSEFKSIGAIVFYIGKEKQ